MNSAITENQMKQENGMIIVNAGSPEHSISACMSINGQTVPGQTVHQFIREGMHVHPQL